MNFMNKIKEIKDCVKRLYSKNKKLFLITISIVCIFIFVVVYIFISSKQTSKNKTNLSADYVVSDYTNKLENKLCAMLLKIDDIKDVSVLVMVKSTPIVNYLTENQNNETTNSNGNNSSSSSSEVVFEKESGTSSPIVVSTTMPEINGVLIVTNKIDATTRLAIINAISAVLNVDSSCICILQER